MENKDKLLACLAFTVLSNKKHVEGTEIFNIQFSKNDLIDIVKDYPYYCRALLYNSPGFYNNEKKMILLNGIINDEKELKQFFNNIKYSRNITINMYSKMVKATFDKYPKLIENMMESLNSTSKITGDYDRFIKCLKISKEHKEKLESLFMMQALTK